MSVSVENRNILRPGVVLLTLALLAGGKLSAQDAVCNCLTEQPFGSCWSNNFGAIPSLNYPGQFPGPVAVVARAGEDPWIFIADLFGGETYRYNGDTTAILTEAPVAFRSPRGTSTTSGLAYVPSQDRLYWAIGGTTIDRIVVTEAPAADATTIDDVLVDAQGAMVPLELEIDLNELARLLFGDESRAGSIGDITYHAGRDTLWAVDIVNDVYFEITLDGELSLDNEGMPVHFRNPALGELSDKAFGNSLTYVENADGQFFDLLVGSIADGRPTRVVRVLASAAPGSESEIGAGTGLEYPLFEGLIADDPPGTAWPSALAHWPDSCTAGQVSELLTVFDPAGARNNVYQISVDTPSVTNVVDLSCGAISEREIELTWGNTGRYDTLEIFRESLSDPSAGEVMVFATTGAEDPERFVDTTFGIPVDGTYRYRVATSAAGMSSNDLHCTETIGRGRLIEVEALPSVSGTSEPAPFAVTVTDDHIYVVDDRSGVAQRLSRSDLEPAGTVEGPFAGLGRTTGITFDSDNQRLFWLGEIANTPVIRSTNLGGSDAGTPRLVQFPTDLVGTPRLGDLAHEPGSERLWMVDRRHHRIFAVDRQGALLAETVTPPVMGVLGGGIAVAGSVDGKVTIDLTTGSELVADTIVRNEYDPAAIDMPVNVHTLLLRSTTGSVSPGGIGILSRTVDGEPRSFQVVVSKDTNRIFTLQLDDAEIGSLPFIRGDANDDGSLNISDPSFILIFLFRSGVEPKCANAADADDNGAINLTDAIMLFSYLFRGGAEPPAPGLTCGFESTPSDLGCESSLCATGGV